ncbi:MAG TPA: ABC transporter permease, partial [Gemmatimonadales bacterium]|nr:ABC transporter permease [Gemmatimonadales bacterium]
EALAVFKPWQPTLTGLDQPERLEGQQVSWEFLQVLDVSPALGRGFTAEDDRAGAARVIVLSDRLWRVRFGADPTILGRQIALADQHYTVIGVMPRNFSSVVAPGSDVWSPLRYDMTQDRSWGHHLRMVGRLRPGITAEAAALELDGIARQQVPEFARRPWASLQGGLLLVLLQQDLTRGVRPALLAVLAAVGLLLLIASVNGTSLVLARGIRRRGEFAVRSALGAGRARLVRQLVIEHLVLALTGGVVGGLDAAFGVRALVALRPPGLPRVDAIQVDAGLFLLALAIALVVGLVFGLVAAVQATGEWTVGTLQLASRRLAGSHRRVRSALVVTQVALALVLLIGSGLLLRSMRRLLAVDPGFAPEHLLTLQVQLSGSRYGSDSTAWRFFEDAIEAVRRVPGVTAASLTSQLPLSGDVDLYGVRLDPPVSDDPGEGHGTFRYAVSPDFFGTMGIPLLRGRLLNPGDRAGAAPVAIVSAALARRRFGERDPIGQRNTIGSGASYTVVGIVGDVRQVSLALDDASAVYTTPSQWRFADNTVSVVIRSEANTATLVPAVRQAIWSVDRDQAVVRVATMDALIARTAAERRFTLLLFGCFAIAALLLAAAGVYGVVAGSVAERTREFGVRAALGATPERIVGMVLGQGVALTGAGIAIGLAGALGASRFLRTMLFSVSPLDPATYAGVLAMLGCMAVLASLLPAWRAVRASP